MTIPTIPTTAAVATTTAAPADADRSSAVAAFAERIGLAAIASFELATMELGLRLGLYGALSGAPATAPELAARAGIDARYAREWLEQQATSGILAVAAEPADGDADQRAFALPTAHAACLLDPDSLAAVAPTVTFAVAGPAVLPQLVEAYRKGTGLPFSAYGEWVRRAQEGMNRPQFGNLLVSEWLPSMPDVLARLTSGAARVADVGSGCGWSAIALARGFDTVTVDGFDSDEESVRDATANAVAAGVGSRFGTRAPALRAATTSCAASRRCTTSRSRSPRSQRCVT
jgi:hypothetical protein